MHISRMKKRGASSSAVIIVLLLIVIAGLGYALWHVRTTASSGATATTSPSATNTAWKTYTSTTFHTTFLYPPEWVVYEGTLEDGSTPAITAYKKGTTPLPPYTHHSDVTHVSMFPKGIPTEGVVGATVGTDVHLVETAKRILDYVLDDGARWATMMTFAHPPQGWEAWGFAWASLAIRNKQTACMRDGKEVSEAACDTLAGDDVVLKGSVDAEDRAREKKILESIRFVR